MPRAKSDTVQIAMRIPTSWLKDAGEIAQFLSRPGIVTTRTEALRAAMARGLELLKDEAAAKKRS